MKIEIPFVLKNPGITTLLNSKKNREVLFSFWLILTGLMYMYYSTIVTSPDLFIRDNISDTAKKEINTITTTHLSPYRGFAVGLVSKLSNVSYSVTLVLAQNFKEFLLNMTWVAHIWVGFFCYYMWSRTNGSPYLRFIDYILGIKRTVFYNTLLKLIGFNPSQGQQKENGEGQQKENGEEKNLDTRMIIVLGFILIPIGVIGIVVFLFLQPYGSLGVIHIIYVAGVILVANAGWALIPSMLASRFPVHLRNTGSSLAYNGGLVIGFASPFLIMENYLNFKNEYIIFFAMILGSISMIIGGLRLMHPIQEF